MKKKTATVLLCAGLAICLSGYFCAQIKADDAFIVEEEVFIGGESLQEGDGQVSLPVQMPEVPPPTVQETTTRQEQVKPVEESGTKTEKTPVSQNSISQNHLAPVFQVPVRRSEAEVSAREQEEKSLQPPEFEEKEVQPPEEVHTSESEIPPSPAERDPWWMIAVGGIFFLGGCARLVWRVRGRK